MPGQPKLEVEALNQKPSIVKIKHGKRIISKSKADFLLAKGKNILNHKLTKRQGHF